MTESPVERIREVPAEEFRRQCSRTGLSRCALAAAEPMMLITLGLGMMSLSGDKASGGLSSDKSGFCGWWSGLNMNWRSTMLETIE
ncbi:MAG: hypothetical protein R6V85_09780 [Polyangia bacterium]